MTAVVQFGIPKSLLLTANQRLHWAKKKDRTRELRRLAMVWTINARNKPLTKAHCLVEITWPDRRRRDAHNLMPSIKACIDGMVDAGLLIDDDDTHLTGPDLRVTAPLSGYLFAAWLSFTFTPLPNEAS